MYPAPIDEEEIKRQLRTRGAAPADTAAALAEEKARAVSPHRPRRFVIGADQVLELDGRAMDKPADFAEAALQLSELSARSHELISSVCVARDGSSLWAHTDRARLHVRPLSDEFIRRYLAEIGDIALSGPGAYQLEGLGAQLFSRVEGDFFTVLGLPLLPLLQFLRDRGILTS